MSTLSERLRQYADDVESQCGCVEAHSIDLRAAADLIDRAVPIVSVEWGVDAEPRKC